MPYWSCQPELSLEHQETKNSAIKSLTFVQYRLYEIQNISIQQKANASETSSSLHFSVNFDKKILTGAKPCLLALSDWNTGTEISSSTFPARLGFLLQEGQRGTGVTGSGERQ